jgi:hypothetical protein
MELNSQGYGYIIGARIKNETKQIKEKILDKRFKDGQIISIKKDDKIRIVVSFSEKRAAKDEHNRMRGLKRLEKKINAVKLTKANINNKGYNKYLRLTGEVKIEIDYEKFEQDKVWDGLKGYITNTKLSKTKIVQNYGDLWYIERAFRMSKTDLRIRPIYHRLVNRIEAHICISFKAYSIYKELERILHKEKSTLSVQQAAELTRNMNQISYTLPESRHTRSMLLKMDDKQTELSNIIKKEFWVSH